MHWPTDPNKPSQKRKNPESVESQSAETHPRKRVYSYSGDDDDLSIDTVLLVPESSNVKVGDQVDFNSKFLGHPNGGSEIRLDFEWDPTINQQLHGLLDQPSPSPRPTPVDATSSILTSREVNRINRRKISSNFRRKKLILWMLIYSYILTWTGFINVLQRLYDEDDNLFSMTIIKSWLAPCLIAESVLTGLTVFAVMIKMKLIQNKLAGLSYHFLTALTNLHYLLTLLGLPFGIYFFFTELSTNMRAELNECVTLKQGPSTSWNVTQMKRHCCGHHGRHDWKVDATHVQDYDNDNEGGVDSGGNEVHVGDAVYPRTCCNVTLLLMTNMECTESSKAYWTGGCHDTEFFVILDYFVCILGLMLIALFLSVFIRLWVDKLERYLTIFRPTVMFRGGI